MAQARQRFAEPHRAAQERAGVAARQAQDAAQLIRRIDSLADDRMAPPYPQLRRIGEQMKIGAKSLRAQARGLQKLRTSLRKLAAKTTILRPGTPKWPRYRQLEALLHQRDATSRSAADAFERLPKQLSALRKEHRIGPQQTAGFGAKMGVMIKAMDRSLNDASAKVATVQPLLEAADVNPVTLRRVQAAMVQLEGATQARARARRTALRFRRETEGGATAIFGPGMVTFDLFARLADQQADLQAASDRISVLIEGLNPP
jgi:hypothetical protein